VFDFHRNDHRHFSLPETFSSNSETPGLEDEFPFGGFLPGRWELLCFPEAMCRSNVKPSWKNL